MIQAQLNQIYIFKDPEIVSFEGRQVGVICAHEPRSKAGGCVMVGEASPTRLRTILTELAHDLRRAAGNSVASLEVKVCGSGVIVDAAKKITSELGLQVKGQHLDPEKLVAYFYSDTGRVRVQSESPSSGVSAGPIRRKRVLIVDDSSVVRKVLIHLFETDPDLEIVGAAESPHQVEKMIVDLKPDVITLDINMPEIDGITLLQRYLPRHPVPTVMISSISMEEGDQVLRALEIGAVDYIQKPSFSEIDTLGAQICERVKMAASVRVQKRAAVAAPRAMAASDFDQSLVVAIGASTGGTEALRHVLCRLPDKIPPIVIVQHIPPVFSAAFAKRLNELCPFEVKEAVDGDLVIPNRVLIAPGGKQMKVVNKSGPLKVVITDDAPVNRHKPSVDYLFDSVAEVIGKRALGVILTGMGNDGARGMVKMKQAGARTMAQDEASCVVFGMPKEAIKLGGAESVVSLEAIPETLVRWLARKG